MGKGLDIIHIPFAIGYMLLGQLWVPKPFWAVTMALILALQVVCLGCPLMVVSGWLRRFEDPNYNVTGSAVAWAYRKYGRWVMAPATLLCFLGTIYFFSSLNTLNN